MALDRLRKPQRVQAPNNYILPPSLYYNYYYRKPKYLIFGYLDPLGSNRGLKLERLVPHSSQILCLGFRGIGFRVWGFRV